MAVPVGIDLGTTNSLVARLENGQPTIVPNARGGRSTPSVVGLDASGRLHVGASARAQLLTHPDRTVAEVKRSMGTTERVRLGDRTYTPTEVSGLVLRALKEDASLALGDTVEEAVVTVPAYFTDAQRQATKDAGELAGLRVERILNEPTAAALAYGIDRLDAEEHVVVYDLGGGTFDVSVLEMFGGVLDVKATAGNNRLGGGDFDRLLVDHLRAEILRTHGADLRGDARAMARLLAAAERAKMELSDARSAVIDLPLLAPNVSFRTEVSRATFDALVEELVRSTLTCLDAALADAKIAKGTVSEIVLVGGSSRVPLVRQRVAEYFGKEPRTHVNPDEAVALGAAIQMGLKTGGISAETGIMITDVAPFTLGVETQSRAGSQTVYGTFAPIIPRNSTVPVSRTERFSTTADGQKSVTVRVFQGESRYTKNNVFLDEYTIDGVPPSLAGRESVAITFTYDINGILDVTTEVVSTGKKASLVIDKSPRRMTDEERSAARARLDREWGSAPAPTPVAPSAADEGLTALVAVAKEKLSATSSASLEALVAEAERAVAAGDRAKIVELDAKLTEALFALDG